MAGLGYGGPGPWEWSHRGVLPASAPPRQPQPLPSVPSQLHSRGCGSWCPAGAAGPVPIGKDGCPLLGSSLPGFCGLQLAGTQLGGG